MTSETYPCDDHALRILEQVEAEPEVTQAALAARLGVAVGSVNWYVKRLVAKGFVKVTHLQRRRLRYLITAQGIAEKTRLTLSYMEVSLRLYRQLRQQSRVALELARARGYDTVCVNAVDDAGDIVRLTCLEYGIAVRPMGDSTELPMLTPRSDGLEVDWPPGPGEAALASSGREDRPD
jgi:DNA-binding MarR family transcriptional regulator